MPQLLEVAVAKGDVSRVFELIAKFSHETHAKLPLQYQAFWAFEDLVALATGHLVTYVIKQYRSQKSKAKSKTRFKTFEYTTRDKQFMTYLYLALENLFKDLIEEAYAEKRMAAVFSGDTQVAKVNNQEFKLFDMLAFSQRYHTAEDSSISRIDAENAFVVVYALASSHLRRHLINWCIQPKVTKYKLTGSKFQDAVEEFRGNGYDEILTADQIRTIQNDVICRNKCIVAALRHQTVIREGRPSLETSMLSDVEMTYA